jgi:hypothetical protein
MLSGPQANIVEQIMFVIVILACLYGLVASYKRYKTLAGADLMFLGFLLYGAYAALAIFLPGPGGSYFIDFTLVGELNSQTAVHFVSLAMRLGLILIIIGLFRIGRAAKE